MEEALIVGDFLLNNLGMLIGVTSDTMENNGSIYRMRIDVHQALNTKQLVLPITSESERLDPFCLLRGANDILNGILGNWTHELKVDCVNCRLDPEYKRFERAMAQLQNVGIAEFTPNEMKVFMINLYNLCIKYAFIEVGIPNGSLRKLRFLNDVKIRLGQYDYSFNDIEHGILRANARAIYSTRRMFSKNDPRMQHAVKEMDPRIHHALNCGAESCPPVKQYTPDNVDYELDLAAVTFYKDKKNLQIDVENKRITISMIHYWYHRDFGKNSTELLQFLQKYVSGKRKADLKILEGKGKLSIKFVPFDWTHDYGRHDKYTGRKKIKMPESPAYSRLV